MKKTGVKKSGAIWHILSLWVLFGALSSCVSTEPVDPSSGSDDKVPLVLNLKMDEAASTRAEANHSGFKLRYIAKMFEGSFANLNSVKERKEMIAAGDANQMVFYVDPNQTYSFIVYADYIPSDTQKNSDNEYGDYYYDTHTNKDMVTMLTSPKGNFSDVTVDFFNNDNYDFFAGAVQIEKRDETIIRDVVLKRRVAKVRFVDNSTNSGVYTISVSSFRHIRNFTIDDGSTNAMTPTQHDQQLVVSPNKFVSNSGDKEVLFFYTFAHEYADNSLTALTMNVSSDNGVSQKIEANNIPLQMNYITTVKGKLLPDSSGSNNPGGNDNPGSGGSNNPGGDGPGTENPGSGNDNPGTGGDNPGTGGDNPGTGGDDNPGNDGPSDPSLGAIYLNLSMSDNWFESPSYVVSQ